MIHKRGSWAIKKQTKTALAKAPVTKPFGKKGQTRVVQKKTASVYHTPGQKPHKDTRKKRAQPTPKLKASIKSAGQVLILLAGKHKGKRVVFLKQLPSGLLLVTGPYKANGVPLKRVHQAYTIATSTKVDLGSFKLDDKFTDDYFGKAKGVKKDKSEEGFFTADKKKTEEKYTVDASKVQDQKTVDAAVVAAVQKVPVLMQYLGTRFNVSRTAPHTLKF